MARNEEIAIKLTADDEASPAITKLAKKIDGLESDEARIIVTADTKKLEAQLDRAKQKLEGLEGDEASVHARLISTIEEDLEQANKLLEQLDGQTATVKIDTVGAKQGIDDLGKSADSSKSVLANMVGNSTQDIGALGGVAGSAGVAIGQMGEYMADARASGEGWGSIIKNFGAMVGPIAAITAGTIVLQKVMGSIAETKAFDKKRAEDYAAAIEEVGDNAQAVLKVLKETQAVTGRAGGIFGTKALEGTKDITETLREAEVGADQWAAAVAKGGAPLDETVAKLEKLKAAAEAAYKESLSDADRQKILDAADAIEILREERQKFADAAAADSSFAQWAADSEAGRAATEAWSNMLKGGIGVLEGNTDALDDNADAAKETARRADILADGIAGITDEYDILSGRLDTSTSLVNLAQGFDDVAAMAFESTVAISEGSLEAQSKLRDQAVAQNELKQEVADTVIQLGEIPPTVVTQVSALIDQGSFDEAEELFKTLTRNRTMEISIIAKGGDAFANNRINGIR